MAPRDGWVAFAVGMSVLLPTLASNEADKDENLVGPLASFSLARAYWSVAITVCGISIVLLAIMAYKFLRDPIYSEWPILIYAPLLVSDFMFSFPFLVHHIYNISSTTEENYGAAHMIESFPCRVAWVGMAGGTSRYAAFTALGWAPWYAIRCSKDFRRSNMPKGILIWMVVSLTSATAFLVPVGFLTGIKSTSGLWCPSMSEEPWQIGVCNLVLPTICFTAFGVFLIMAHMECKHLSKTAQVDSVRRIARESQNLALASFGFCLLFNAPYVIMVLAFFLGLGDLVSPGFVAYAGMFVKFGPWGTVGLLLHHAKTLRSRSETNQALYLEFQEAPLDGEEEDVGLLENRGVSLPFLISFVSKRGIDSEASTGDVMQGHVVPESRPRKCCYVELVKSWVDSDGVRAVKKPQYFVSHCWADAFCALLEQLLIFSDREARTVAGPFHFWVDIFAINQHDVGSATELPMLPRVIEKSQAVLFTLNPWFEPKTLRRVWCLWELLQAVKNDVKVRPTMPESEELNFLDTIWQDSSKIKNMLETVDVQQADATVLSDKETIFAEIASSVGFDAMNSMVQANLRRCLQGVAIDRFFGFSGSVAGLKAVFRSEASRETRRFQKTVFADPMGLPKLESEKPIKNTKNTIIEFPRLDSDKPTKNIIIDASDPEALEDVLVNFAGRLSV